MSVAEIERWLAPILNYIPAQDQSAQERAVRAAMPAAVAGAEPANAAASRDLASHPPGCACAVHLAWRKKAVGTGEVVAYAFSVVMAGLVPAIHGLRRLR